VREAGDGTARLLRGRDNGVNNPAKGGARFFDWQIMAEEVERRCLQVGRGRFD